MTDRPARRAFRDPEACPTCGQPGRIRDSRKRSSKRVVYRRRVHRCAGCKQTWTSYQCLIHPKRAIEALLCELASI